MGIEWMLGGNDSAPEEPLKVERDIRHLYNRCKHDYQWAAERIIEQEQDISDLKAMLVSEKRKNLTNKED